MVDVPRLVGMRGAQTLQHARQGRTQQMDQVTDYALPIWGQPEHNNERRTGVFG